MSDAYLVIYTDEAKSSLREIIGPIVPVIAKTIDSLNQMPYRFRQVGETRRRRSSVHIAVVEPFLIYYRIDEQDKTVRILLVRHGARKQPRRFN